MSQSQAKLKLKPSTTNLCIDNSEGLFLSCNCAPSATEKTEVSTSRLCEGLKCFKNRSTKGLVLKGFFFYILHWNVLVLLYK